MSLTDFQFANVFFGFPMGSYCGIAILWAQIDTRAKQVKLKKMTAADAYEVRACAEVLRTIGIEPCVQESLDQLQIRFSAKVATFHRDY